MFLLVESSVIYSVSKPIIARKQTNKKDLSENNKKLGIKNKIQFNFLIIEMYA